jgi:hypothetical protein
MNQTIVELPKAAEYERALARELDGAKASEITSKAGDRYNDLYAERKRYDNHALRQHLAEGILPGIALYQTLLDDPGTQQRSLDLVEVALTEGAAARRRSMERLGRLPVYYWLMRGGIKPMMRLNFHAEGWETEWVETSGDALAFTMTRCFYLDVLEGYGVPELTALYCRMDDLVYEDVSPYVKWDRKHTLGRGDDCCDFRFERVRRQ